MYKEGIPDFRLSELALIREIKRTLNDSNRYPETYAAIEKLEKMQQHFSANTLDRDHGARSSAIYIECAMGTIMLFNWSEAVGYLELAKKNSVVNRHYHGIVLWLLGCAHWLAGREVEAIISWEYAIDAFRNYSQLISADNSKRDWYSEKIIEMEDSLRVAVETQFPPLPGQKEH